MCCGRPVGLDASWQRHRRRTSGCLPRTDRTAEGGHNGCRSYLVNYHSQQVAAQREPFIAQASALRSRLLLVAKSVGPAAAISSMRMLLWSGLRWHGVCSWQLCRNCNLAHATSDKLVSRLRLNACLVAPCDVAYSSQMD
jgi:hypothetical protein